MHDIADFKKWCDEARKILSKLNTEGPKKMGVRNEEVAGLLEKMKGSPACTDGSEFKKEYQRLKVEYERLAKIARDTLASGFSEKDKKAEIVEVSLGLKKLAEKARLAMGKVDPNATESVRKAVLDEARNKPVYEDKWNRILAAIEELKRLPGTDAQVKKLDALLEAGSKAEPDYEVAYKALEGLSGALKEGREAAKKFGEKAGGEDFQKKLTEARTAISNYGKFAGIADAQGVAAARNELEIVVKSFDQPTEDKKKAAKQPALDKLEEIIVGLAKKTEDLEKLRVTAEERQSDATKLVNDVFRWSPVAVSAPWIAAFKNANALVGSQQFALASEAFGKLNVNILPDHGTYKAGFEEWAKTDADLKNKHEPALQEARKQLSIESKQDGGKDPNIGRALSLQQDAFGPIEQAILRARNEYVARREFPEAVALIEGVIVDLPKVVGMVNSVKKGENADLGFADGEKTIRARYLIQELGVKAAGKALDTKLNELDTAGGDRTAFAARLEKDRPNWTWTTLEQKVFDSKVDVAARLQLSENLANAGRDAVSFLDAIRVDVEKMLNNEGGSLDKSKQAKDFEAKRVLAFKAMTHLGDYGLADGHDVMKANPDVTSLRADYITLVELAKAGTYQPAKMDKLAFDFKNKSAFIDDELKKRSAAAVLKANELTKAINALAKQNESYKAYFGSLRDSVTDCLGLTGSTIASVIKTGEDQLETTRKELEAIKINLESKDANAKNYKQVEVKMKALETRIKNKELAEYQPTFQKTFETRFEKVLPDAIHLLSPAGALTHLKEFDDEISEVMALITQAKTDRDTLNQEVVKAKKELEKMGKTTAPKLYESLSKRIEAAAGCPKGEEKRALVDLQAVQILILRASQSTDRAGAMEDKVKRDIFEAERQKVAYKAAADVFEKNAKRTADAKKEEFTTLKLFTSSDCNVDVYDQMEMVFKEAQKLAKADNYAAANEKLRQATGLANYFVANPFNPASTARKELIRINDQWKTAVSGYLKDLADLEKSFTDEASVEPKVAEGVVKSASGAITEIRGLFNAAAFDSAAELLSTEMKDPKEYVGRLQRKEAALAAARRLQRTLAGHAILKEVVGNPFNSLTAKPLVAALASMEGALLAS